jgi:hypothetical protein
MSEEYEEPEYEFEPTEQPEPEAKAHHFAVNPSFREQHLDELEEDVSSTVDDTDGDESLVPFVRQQVGLRMLHWHSGQGDPIYAVGSFYYYGDPYPLLNVMMAAESRLDTLWNQAKSRSEEKRELGLILNWLRWEIAQASGVNNNPGEVNNNPGMKNVHLTIMGPHQKFIRAWGISWSRAYGWVIPQSISSEIEDGLEDGIELLKLRREQSAFLELEGEDGEYMGGWTLTWSSSGGWSGIPSRVEIMVKIEEEIWKLQRKEGSVAHGEWLRSRS